MKLAFSGVQCSGKSTLIKKLKETKFLESIYEEKFEYVEEAVRSLIKKGYKINEEGNDDTQNEISKIHLLNATRNENLVLDRCSLDGCAYAIWSWNHDKISDKSMEFAKNVMLSTLSQYDYVFYVEPEFELVNDGVRSLNKEYQNEMIMIFRSLIALFPNKIIKLEGSIEERFEYLESFLRYEIAFKE